MIVISNSAYDLKLGVSGAGDLNSDDVQAHAVVVSQSTVGDADRTSVVVVQGGVVAPPRSTSAHVIIDLETTGLRPLQDRILEFGAVRVRGGEITDTFTRLVRQADGVPAAITALTGIDEAMAARDGVPLNDALPEFLAFIGQERLVGYHLAFDMAFLREACKACG